MATENYFEVTSDEEFTRIHQSGNDKPVVIDFHATWCQPCKRIAPKFKQLSTTYPQVLFIKVDVDQCTETAASYGVSSMPTFKFELRGRIIDTMSGADPTALATKTESLVNSAGSQTPMKSEVPGAPGMVDLEQFIVQKNCLNENEDHPFKWVFEDNKDLYLESDCDAEILMSMTFNQSVKLHSIKCQGPDTGHAPKTVKIFINQPNLMDFDAGRDNTPVQQLQLSKDDVVEGNIIPLKFVKFQSVNNVTLFFSDNQSDEEVTQIQRIVIYGKTISTTNMEEFKRISGKKGESH
nr:thioredoxin-like protein 1 [Ciona intestinalis]XP_026692246.1 thioredoxin-like protein 1 [Ciona intestinalis]|eukprot:XP_009859947.1 thioredoxin-like protein 1 [Ciona intestinalis]